MTPMDGPTSHAKPPAGQPGTPGTPHPSHGPTEEHTEPSGGHIQGPTQPLAVRHPDEQFITQTQIIDGFTNDERAVIIRRIADDIINRYQQHLKDNNHA